MSAIISHMINKYLEKNNWYRLLVNIKTVLFTLKDLYTLACPLVRIKIKVNTDLSSSGIENETVWKKKSLSLSLPQSKDFNFSASFNLEDNNSASGVKALSETLAFKTFTETRWWRSVLIFSRKLSWFRFMIMVGLKTYAFLTTAEHKGLCPSMFWSWQLFSALLLF